LDIGAVGQVPDHGAEHGPERGGDDVAVDTHAEARGGIADAQFDIAGGARVGAGADGVFVVVHDAHGHVQRRHEGRDGAVAGARHHAALAVVVELDLDAELFALPGARVAVDAVAHQFPGRVLLQVFTIENGVHVVRRDFAPGFVGDALDGAAEFDLQAARQHQAVFLFEQVRHPALTRLAVDANDRIVAAAQVGRVDRQVRHFPYRVGLLLRKALLDGVLVRAGERGEHQVAGIRVARMHGQLVAVLRATAHFVDVGEVQARVHALRVQVQRQRHQVDVAGALAAAEQAAFDAVGARHDGEFGGRHGGAAVIVRVHAQHDAVAARQVLVHPFDLVGVQVGGGGLDGGRQVQHHLLLRRGLPHVGHGVGDFQGELGLGGAEDLGRVFIAPVGLGMPGHVLLDPLRARDRDLLDLVLAHVEDDLAERRRTRVVQVHHGLPGAGRGFDGAADQVLARLGQHDDGDVVGNALLVHQLAHEVEIRLRRGGDADLDCLETDLDHLLEETQLALDAHRLDQRLVAVAQVGAHPDGRLRNAAARPGAFGKVAGERRERYVFGGGVGKHQYTSINIPGGWREEFRLWFR